MAMSARFDTHFLAATSPPDCRPEPDLVEVDAARFVAPAFALDEGTSGSWRVPPPTMRVLAELARFDRTQGFLDYVLELQPVRPIRPRLRLEGDTVVVVAPGEEGFDELDDYPSDPQLLDTLRRLAADPRRSR